MDTVQPDASSLILVAVIKNPRDLEIARLLGWYRIPLRSAPKVVSVDYLAFYQTGAFTENRWQIQYLAQVRGHELTTRADLLRDEPDHPHAQREYFKIQIGPLIQLEKPIIADQWRRITFFYTTGEYLLKASSISDLIIQSDARQVLWQALRERGSQESQYHLDALPDEDLPASILAVILGLNRIEPDQNDLNWPSTMGDLEIDESA
jgi:hypothetical protein